MPVIPVIAVKDSILESTKKMIGLDASYDAFDLDITTHINSAFSTLYQAGVGPLQGFFITDSNDNWAQFIGNKMYINDVKTYIFLRVRLLFDPPTSSFGLAAIEKQIDELIWRLNVADDSPLAIVNQTPDPIPGNGIDDFVYNLTGGIDFPESAPTNALGIDTLTGSLYRKG